VFGRIEPCGGSAIGGIAARVDNIGVFEDDGFPRRMHPLLLDPSPTAHPSHIARGFALVGDDLYIANAWRKDSHIALYQRHGDTHSGSEPVLHHLGIQPLRSSITR
jgi:hypothetical protein